MQLNNSNILPIFNPIKVFVSPIMNTFKCGYTFHYCCICDISDCVVAMFGALSVGRKGSQQVVLAGNALE